MSAILFKETQGMNGPFMIVGGILLLVFGIIYGLRAKKINRPVAIIIGIVGAFTLLTLFMLQLKTIYYTDHVDYQFGSFFTTTYETIRIDSVAEARVLSYAPMDYGGYGMKGNSETIVCNASGNKGILFTFHHGKSLLLGTQYPDSLIQKLKGYYPLK
jgi:hypothetical protein